MNEWKYLILGNILHVFGRFEIVVLCLNSLCLVGCWSIGNPFEYNLYRFCSEISCWCKLGFSLSRILAMLTIGVVAEFNEFQMGALRLVVWSIAISWVTVSDDIGLVLYLFVIHLWFDLSSGRCPRAFQFPISRRFWYCQNPHTLTLSTPFAICTMYLGIFGYLVLID